MPVVMLIAVLTCRLPAQAQTATSTVLDGVYTDAQAARGAAVFATTCSRCHGDELEGKSDPALRGDGFVDRWREDSLRVLFTHIRTLMPSRGAGTIPPGSLPESTYLDLLAHILKSNGYPAGAQELTADVAANTQMVGLDGPKPLPTNSLVLVVGCFTARPNNVWAVTNASDPVRVRIADETNAEEMRSSAARPLGTQTFRLQNLSELRPDFRPDPYVGKKVQVKGALIRHTNNDRIIVLSLAAVNAEAVDANCAH
jgi:cytochrome c5